MTFRGFCARTIQAIRYCLPCFCRATEVGVEIGLAAALTAINLPSEIPTVTNALNNLTTPALIGANAILQDVQTLFEPKAVTRMDHPAIRRVQARFVKDADYVIEDTRDVSLAITSTVLKREDIASLTPAVQTAILEGSDVLETGVTKVAALAADGAIKLERQKSYYGL